MMSKQAAEVKSDAPESANGARETLLGRSSRGRNDIVTTGPGSKFEAESQEGDI
jgi:hypothetical protein